MTAREERAELKRVIRTKRQMLDLYTDEIAKLEAQAQNLRGAAQAIESGIVKAEQQLQKLK